MSAGLALFSSWHGRYSDSPRAISEELRRRGAPVRQAWVVDGAAPLPDGVQAVTAGDPRERELLEQARWIVSNDVLPVGFAKAPDATYLQTWHGTPLKRIAYDVERPSAPEAEHHYAVELGRDVAAWDVLLSPNHFSTEILRGAFRFAGEVLETGYPRNDLLSSPERDAVRARVRDTLGLEDGVRAVLYAPTWRDTSTFALELDLDELRAGLGDEVVVLVRAHGLVAASARVPEGPAVRDVTRWPDIRELYLAADVLLSDYSSAMFDFAITRRPMLFYTYDLATYRDELRGFYFDFEAEAPGPLLATTGEVVAALRDLDAVVDRYADAYERFWRRFCHLEDGHAAARVVDAVFGEAGGAR